jgi:DNA repair protein RadA/Sms
MDTTDSELNRGAWRRCVPGSLSYEAVNQEWENTLLQISLKLPIKLYMFLAKKNKNKMRQKRITSTSDNYYILTETKTQNIFKQIEADRARNCIIDSIQTLHTDYIESTAGSISN